MSYYIRIGNQSILREELERLKPAEIEKIKQDAARAEQMRKDNLANSLGLNALGLKKDAVSFTPDIRPGSELSKAIAEDKEIAVLEKISEESKKKEKTSSKKTKVEGN